MTCHLEQMLEQRSCTMWAGKTRQDDHSEHGSRMTHARALQDSASFGLCQLAVLSLNKLSEGHLMLTPTVS